MAARRAGAGLAGGLLLLLLGSAGAGAGAGGAALAGWDAAERLVAGTPSEPACPAGCSGRGVCVPGGASGAGTCLCRAPFGGEGCVDELWRDDLPARFPGLVDAPRLEAHRAGGEGSRGWRRLRVLMVTAEAEGPARCGGIGTAFTALAERLAANGHDVTVLFTPGEAAAQPAGAWGAHVEAYAARGVRLLGLPRRATPRSHPHLPRHLAESFEVLHFLRAAGGGGEGDARGGGSEPGGGGIRREEC